VRTRLVCRAEAKVIDEALRDELGELAEQICELAKEVDAGLSVRFRWLSCAAGARSGQRTRPQEV